MASFPTRRSVAKTKARRRTGPTFIQRSRQESSEQKAIFHSVTGAGRSHVVRDFFALSHEDKDVARSALQAALNARAAGHTR